VGLAVHPAGGSANQNDLGVRLFLRANESC
jgi:hypothetical protein